MKTLLLGDLIPYGPTQPLFETGAVEALFTDTLSLFEGNDVNFVNVEFALTDSGKEVPKFGPALKSSPKTAQTMRKMGINYCGLSNNHIFDFGVQGALDTMQALDAAGIVYTGFGKNYDDSRKDLVIEKDGEKLCIIAVCEHEYSYALEDRMGSRPFDEFDTMEDIRKAKAENDRVIVVYHGGKEHCRYPSPRLLRVCRAMVRNGADVVLCQHSHCIGCYENYQGGHILYGQGNFHYTKLIGFDAPDTWNGALAVKYDTKSHEMEFIPMVIASDTAIELAKGAEKERLMTLFARLQEELQNGHWKQGWHDFCEENRAFYVGFLRKCFPEDATEREAAVFGHFLDCEAHADVCRELYPSWNLTNEK